MLPPTFPRLNTVRCLLFCLFVLLNACVSYGQDLRLSKDSQDFKHQKDIHSFDFSSDKLKSIINTKSSQLSLEVELPDSPTSTVSLTRSQTFNNSRFLDSDGNLIPFTPLIYTGHIHHTKSLVSLTFSDEGVTGIISVGGKNWNLDMDPASKKQRMYADDMIPHGFKKACENNDSEEEFLDEPKTNGLQIKDVSQDKNASLSEVDVYIEADHKLFTDFNSDTIAALNHVTGLMASVNAIFNDAGIDLNFPDIKLWTSMDPYDADNTSSSALVLDRLKCALDGNYNGRLGHLLSTTNRHGGIANRRSSCPYVKPLYGFTGIATNFNTDLNVYSYSIHFIAHEIGHNLSSHHTHACRWNGNDTQLDDCGNILSTNNNRDSNCNGIIDDQAEAEGSDCFDVNNPVLPPSGTIMSYCHANSGVRVDLSQGFHPQVAARMKNFVDNCLSPTVTVYCPIVDTSEMVITYPTPDSIRFSCTRLTDVDTYAWRYRPNIACSQSTTVTTTSPMLVVENRFGNTSYDVECVLRCASTLEYGDWSCEKVAKNPLCFSVRTLTGILDNTEAIMQASLDIHSDQHIVNNSHVSYLYGNEASLHQGFVVEIGSTFLAITSSCD